MRFLDYISLILLLFFGGCNGDNEYVPKRTGYFRISLPEKKYLVHNADNEAFTFEYPVYSKVIKDSGKGNETAWLNVIFPQFRCELYMSYCKVDTNLNAYLEECRKMVTRHEIKASAINDRVVSNVKEKIYGDIFDIEGNTATNLQFYLTDSTKNFLRGALYFYAVPNKDSIEPVLNFVRGDVEHLINTFRWKQQ